MKSTLVEITEEEMAESKLVFPKLKKMLKEGEYLLKDTELIPHDFSKENSNAERFFVYATDSPPEQGKTCPRLLVAVDRVFKSDGRVLGYRIPGPKIDYLDVFNKSF